MRLTIELFGRELAVLDVEWGPAAEDGTRTVVPAEKPSIESGGAALADTAFADQADPDTAAFGFGQLLPGPKPGEVPDRRTQTSRRHGRTEGLR